MPKGHDADRFRGDRSSRTSTCHSAPVSAGSPSKVFRIGHLGSFNDLMLVGTLGGVEMGLRLASVPHKDGGVMAALESLTVADRKPEAVLS